MQLKDLLAALTHDLIVFLKENPDFFAAENRKHTLEKVDFLSPSLKEYLSEVSADDFLADLSVFVEYLGGAPIFFGSRIGLLTAVAKFLTGEFAAFCDAPKEVNISAYSVTLRSEMNRLVSVASDLEINAEISDLLAFLPDTSFIMVQTPRPVAGELRKKIRAHFYQIDQLNFPVFAINKNLIGGLRIFINGKVQDNSWLNMVNKITSITNI